MATVARIRQAISDRYNAAIGRSYLMDYGWSLGYIDGCIPGSELLQGEVAELRAYVASLYDQDLLGKIEQAERRIVAKFDSQ